MRVIIDGNETPERESIASALDAAREHAETTGRLIVDILADGQPIAQSMLDDPPGDDAGVRVLEMTTADPVAFLVETFSDAHASLSLVRQDLGTVADQIRTGELEPAVESLNNMLVGWQSVSDIVSQSAEIAGIDLDTFTFDTLSAADCIRTLGETLQEIRACLTRKDWSSLGDAIEYDLDEQAQRWDALLNALTQRVRNGV